MAESPVGHPWAFQSLARRSSSAWKVAGVADLGKRNPVARGRVARGAEHRGEQLAEKSGHLGTKYWAMGTCLPAYPAALSS